METYYYSAIQVVFSKDLNLTFKVGQEDCTEIEYNVFPNGNVILYIKVNSISHKFQFHEKNILVLQTIPLEE